MRKHYTLEDRRLAELNRIIVLLLKRACESVKLRTIFSTLNSTGIILLKANARAVARCVASNIFLATRTKEVEFFLRRKVLRRKSYLNETLPFLIGCLIIYLAEKVPGKATRIGFHIWVSLWGLWQIFGPVSEYAIRTFTCLSCQKLPHMASMSNTQRHMVPSLNNEPRITHLNED